jgi:hypothetical protein
MNSDFDPYLHWLGIRDPERPPNHYRLLGIELFESDSDVIAVAADRQMAHVRTFQSGKRSDFSQRLLNELAAAKICLLSEEKKAEYDRLLAAKVQARVSEESAGNEDTFAATTEIPDDPYHIQAAESPLRLHRPRRGRGGSRLARSVLVTAAILLATVPAAIYYRSYWQPTTTQTERITEQGQNKTPSPKSRVVSTGTNQKPLTPNGTRIGSIHDSIKPLQPDASLPRPRQSDGSASEIAPWEQPVEPPWQPFRFSATNPLGAFVLALANRDTQTARSQLDTSLRSLSDLSTIELDSLDLFVWDHEQFWQAVDDAVAHLRLAETVEYRQSPITLISRNSNSLVFQAKNKTRKTFSVDRGQIDSELAMALAQAARPQSLPASWRHIGSFLSVDKQGDAQLAEQFLSRAEQSGITTKPVRDALRIIDRLASDDLPAGPPDS